jgi:hypothetical protein
MSQSSSLPGFSPATVRRPKVESIREEAKGAILAEQLSYLLAHGDACPEGCPDCARLRSVEEALLRPFRVKVYSNLHPAA